MALGIEHPPSTSNHAIVAFLSMQLQRLQQLVMPSRCRANISLQRGLSGENFVVQPSCAFLGRGVFRVRSDIIHPGGGPFQIGTKHGHSPWNGGSRRGKAARGSAFTRAVARLGFSRGSAFRRAWPFAGLGIGPGQDRDTPSFGEFRGSHAARTHGNDAAVRGRGRRGQASDHPSHR